MKLRHIKQQLKARGYRLLPKRGKGSHTIWRCESLTIVLSGKKGADSKPYQRRYLR